MYFTGVCLMSLLYLFAGITHFRKPRMYERIMPAWIPAPRFLVFFTGIWEMAAAVLLLVERTRGSAAWSIIVLLVIVFPANVQMAQNFRKKNHPYYWLALLRLPLQVVLIWWAWQYT